MAFFGDADLDAMLADFGVPVGVGSTTVNGIRDQSQDEVADPEYGSGLISRSVFVRVKTGALPGLAPGAAITVDGASLVVVRALELDDGAITRIECAVRT
jgi:hypothetical protein